MSDVLKWIKQQVHSEVEVGKVFRDKWLLRKSRDTLVARVVNNHKRVKQVPMEFETSKLPRRNRDSIMWPTQGVQTSEKEFAYCSLWVIFVYQQANITFYIRIPALMLLNPEMYSHHVVLLAFSNCHKKDFPAGEGSICTFTFIHI